MNKVARFNPSLSALATLAMFGAVSANAALPTYLTTALADGQTQVTELIAVIVPVAIVITLLCIGPKVILRMIKGLASKVSF